MPRGCRRRRPPPEQPKEARSAGGHVCGSVSASRCSVNVSPPTPLAGAGQGGLARLGREAPELHLRVWGRRELTSNPKQFTGRFFFFFVIYISSLVGSSLNQRSISSPQCKFKLNGVE